MAAARRGGWRWTWTSMHGNGGRQAAVATALSELEPGAPDAVLDDLVAHRAAAMLHHRQHARDAGADALAAHDDDRVGGGADVADGHPAGEQILEARLLGGDEQQCGHRR